MAKQSVSRYDQLNVDPRHGGYSDIRLWPCYMVFSASIMFLSPHISMFVSLMIIGIPAFVITKIIAVKQPVQQYDSYRWLKDVEHAMKQKNLLPLPELKDYEIKTAAKTKVTKQEKISPRPAFEQISIPNRIRTKKPTFQSV